MVTLSKSVRRWINRHEDRILDVSTVITFLASLVWNWGLFIWSLTIITEYREVPIGQVPFGKVVIVLLTLGVMTYNSTKSVVADAVRDLKTTTRR